jgi:pilus assembly protein CpaF
VRTTTAGSVPESGEASVADRDSRAPAASAPALEDVPIFGVPNEGSLASLGQPSRSPWVSTGLRLPTEAGDAADDHRRPNGSAAPILERDRRSDWPGAVDWAQVVVLRKEASELISGESQSYRSEHGRPMPAADRLLMGRAIIRRVVNDHVRALHREGSALWSPETERTYAQAVEDSVFGFGRMQPLFEIESAENIEIHGWDSVVVQYGDGRREKLPPVADSDEELVDAIRFLGENARPSRPFDDTHPTMTLALGDRFRLHAVGFGLSYRPSIVIRQHTLTDISLLTLTGGGLMPLEVAQFLDAAVLARKSMVISGDQGAGKTTLLRGLINSIPSTERFGTLETDYELMTHLQPGRGNILALQARIGHGEREGSEAGGNVTVADLFPEALRQNLSRLVVGEVRGNEAFAMFEAMQAGAGTLSTTHSHSAESTMDRLAARVAQGGVLTIDEAYRQVALNIGVFIYVQLTDDTWKGGTRHRFISEIRTLNRAMENGRPVTHLAYSARGTTKQPPGFFPDADFQAELTPFYRRLPDSASVRRSEESAQ